MAADSEPLDKRRATIQSMFSAVAPRYDLLNRILSGRRDVAWRRQAAAALDLPPGSRVVDLCCGTGDQALALHQRGVRVIAADFSLAMLERARRKFGRLDDGQPFGVAGDSLLLPLPSTRFAGATVAFGLRNVEDLRAALAEIARVLEPGGRVAILEFALPAHSFLRRLYLLYFRHLLPLVGRWLSPRGSAYSYLAASVPDFPQRREFADLMREVGFSDARWRDLTAGVVCLYTGERSR